MPDKLPKYWALWSKTLTPRYRIFELEKFDVASGYYLFKSRDVFKTIAIFSLFQLQEMVARDEFLPFTIEGGKKDAAI